MKLKTLSLVAGMALAANMGLAQAAELDETAGIPSILSATGIAGYQAMNNAEMEQTSGEALHLFGKKIWDWGWKGGYNVHFSPTIGFKPFRVGGKVKIVPKATSKPSPKF